MKWDLTPPTPRSSGSGHVKPGENPFDFGPDLIFDPKESYQGRVSPKKLGHSQRDLQRIAAELCRRRKESLQLWEPLPLQDEFHKSCKYIRILLGGNRSGKTVTGAAEAARIVTNQDPYKKYPDHGTMVVVAKDSDALADPIWKRLCEPGAFDIIRDPETGLWRSVRRWQEYDAEHPELWKPSDPLISSRFYDRSGISWHRANLEIPDRLKLKTGWEIRFFTGLAKPKVGFEADVVWIDEEVDNDAWFLEMQARLLDRKGRLFCTATPERATPGLANLHHQYQDGNSDIDEFYLDTRENPHHDKEALDRLMGVMSDDEIAVKIRGEFKIGGTIVFDEWDKSKHIVPAFRVPDDWTRYLSIDPGNNPCACMFLAIPPPEHVAHGKAFLYDELVIKRCSAQKLAEQLRAKTQGQVFERCIVDGEAIRKHEPGTGMTLEQQYRDAFKEVGMDKVFVHKGFTYGVGGQGGGPAIRREALHQWLRGSEPVLQVMKGKCPVFEEEIRRYHFKRDSWGNVTDKIEKKNDHCLDAAMYLAAHDPQWRPSRKAGGPGPHERKLSRKLRKKRRSQDSSVRFGPRGE